MAKTNETRRFSLRRLASKIKSLVKKIAHRTTTRAGDAPVGPAMTDTSFSAALAFLKGALPPPSASTAPVSTETRINWLEHPDLPREMHNHIYSYTMPSEMRMRDNVLGYSSITSLVAGLDALADNSLAPFQQLTISSTGPYNGHRDISIPSTRPQHSCNVCPTLKLSATDCHFEIEFACPECPTQSFYKDELHYACITLTRKVARLTGPRFAGKTVRCCIKTDTRTLATLKGEDDEIETSSLPTYKREVT
jgi:hypothetical protein